MKKYLFLITICIVLFISKAESQDSWMWAKGFGGAGNEFAYGICSDSKGDVYSTGWFAQTMTVGADVLTSFGDDDAFVVKTDRNGNYKWAVKAGGSLTDRSVAVAAQDTSYVYITGFFTGSATFGSYNLTSAGGRDIFIAKLDANNGDFIWAIKAGSASDDEAADITCDASGNTYSTGYYQGSALFGGTNVTSVGDYDCYLTKYDNAGNILWIRTGGSSSREIGHGVKVDTDGNVFLGGYFNSTAAFDASNVISTGSYDVFMAKYSNSGILKWLTGDGGTGADICYGIDVDTLGNSYMTGYISSSATFGSHSVTNNGGRDIFLTKYDSLGNNIWAKSFGGPTDDESVDMSFHGNTIYVCGYFTGTSDFGSYDLTSAGAADGFLISTDTAGVVTWSLKEGEAAGSDNIADVNVNIYGDKFASGYFSNTANFSTIQLIANGGNDGFVGKIGTCTTGLAPIAHYFRNCADSTAVLVATGGSQFNWYTSAVGGTPFASGDTVSTGIIVSPTFFYVSSVNDVCESARDTIEVLPLVPVVAEAGIDQTICYGSSANLNASGGISYLWSNDSITAAIEVLPTVTSLFYVTVTDAVGCTAIDSVEVIVNPLPNINTGSDTTICYGSTISIAATGALNYLWSTSETTSSVSVSPVANTTYTVTGTTAGCSESDEIIVSLLPLPVVIAGVDTNICLGTSATIAASGADNYIWSSGGLTASIVVLPLVNTTYTVTGSVSGCTATDDVVVTVNALPLLTVTNDTMLCSGATVDLNVSGAVSYNWSTSETSATISVSPIANTTYTVTGTIAGCSASEEVVVSVTTMPTIDAGPDITICTGSSASLTATGAGSYSWSSGDNTANIVVSPIVNTTYIVTGSVSGCSATDDLVVSVNNLPTLIVSGDTTVCSGTSVNLTVSGAVTYDWSTGQTSTVVTVTPPSTTTYTVTGTTATCSASEDIVVTVNTIPNTYAGTDTLVCLGNSLILNVNGADTYEWSTNETNSGIIVTPSVTTTYTVTGTTANCSSTDDVIVIVNTLPIAGYTYITDSLEADFTSDHTGYKYFWDFGDGSTSNQQDPIHTFNAGGYFHVCQTVFDSIGECQNIYCTDVEVSLPVDACLAKFAYTLNGNTVTFSDSSLGNPDQWYWQFGDAASSTMQNPTHTYGYNGIYQVKLTTMNNVTGCMDDEEITININSINDCIADFNFYSSLTDNNVSFSDNSTGGFDQFIWNFGNGDTSSIKDPFYTYPVAGYYNVCLTVLNSMTNCYDIKCKEVKVGNDESCLAGFIYMIDTITNTVYFTDRSFGNPDDWQWNFGDGGHSTIQNPSHTYGTKDDYMVHLNIKNHTTHCIDHINLLLNLDSISSLACQFGYNQYGSGQKGQYPYEFMAATIGNPSRYVWNFGDGTTDSTTTTPLHIYSDTGIYRVCLNVTDPTIFMSDTFCMDIDIRDTTTVDIASLIKAEDRLHVFPNPAVSVLYINFIFDPAESNSVQIYSLTGELIYMQKINSVNTAINVSNLPSGIYYVKVLCDLDNPVVKKFVKE